MSERYRWKFSFERGGYLQTKLSYSFSAIHGVTTEMYSERFRQMSLAVKTSIRSRMWGNNCRGWKVTHPFVRYIQMGGNSFQCNPWVTFDLLFQHHFSTERDGPMLPNEHSALNATPFCAVCYYPLFMSFAHPTLLIWCFKKKVFFQAKSCQLSMGCFFHGPLEKHLYLA